jgi:hypothetical protein
MDKRVRRCLADTRPVGARAHWCSSVVAEEDEPDDVVPEGCSTEHERRRRGSEMEVKNGGGLSLA